MISEWISRFAELPPYGLAALLVLILYGVQSEVRFGSRARTRRPGAADRNSTLAVSLSAAIVVAAFVVAMKASTPAVPSWVPDWFRHARLPALPGLAWIGIALGMLGIALRLWAVLTLRERYTRTLLIQGEHPIERNGPYRWVRHPGYLGSLLCLNGVALASGNAVTLAVSLAATLVAYSYRIKVEEEMLVASLGPAYAAYREDVGALLPSLRK